MLTVSASSSQRCEAATKRATTTPVARAPQGTARRPRPSAAGAAAAGTSGPTSAGVDGVAGMAGIVTTPCATPRSDSAAAELASPPPPGLVKPGGNRRQTQSKPAGSGVAVGENRLLPVAL